MLHKRDLKPYQIAAKEHAKQNDKAGLFLEMGLGKTVSTLTAFYELKYEDMEVERMLVIAPKKVAESVWSDEIENWSHLKGLKCSVIAGSEKQRLIALHRKADVYTIGRDNVSWLCEQFSFAKLPFDMLVIDESSSFKNHQSLRFKALKRVIATVPRVVLLTGTPAPNSLIDLWPQMYLLDRGQRLEKTITAFRAKFFRPDKQNGMIVYSYRLQDGAETRIKDAISDICISMKTEDYSSLPESIHNVVKVKFTPELQKAYQDFEKEQIMKLADTEITALNAAGLSIKLRQFANGALYDEDHNYHVIHDLKLEALEEIVEAACGKPILIAWLFQHDRDRIMQKFKALKPRALKDKQDIKDWNEGKISMLLMHPASGGHGLNLQFGGHIIVWFGQDWSLELYQQLNARLRRPGQKQTVMIHHLVAVNSIEEDVVKALESKDKGQESLMKAVKARIDKYLKP